DPDTHGAFSNNVSRQEWRAHSGYWQYAFPGTWGGADNGTAWQEVTNRLDAGATWTAGAWFYNDSGFSCTGATLKIEFYNGTGTRLGANTNNFTGSLPGENWIYYSVGATSPAGTAWVRFKMDTEGCNDSGGLQMDDAVLWGDESPQAIWDGNGGTANWDDATNWLGNTVPGTETNVTFYQSIGSGTNINLSSDKTIAGLRFNDSADTSLNITNKTLTINGGGIALSSGSGGSHVIASTNSLGASQPWTNESSSTLTINGRVRGNGYTATVSGSGGVTLGGTEDNDSLTVAGNAGTVVLNKTSSGSAHAASSVTVGGGTVRFSGSGDDQIWNGGDVTVNSGTFDLNGKAETIDQLALNGAGITNGGALVNGSASAATLTLDNDSSLGSDSTVGGLGNITITGGGKLSGSGGARTLTKVHANTLTLSCGTSKDNTDIFLTASAGTVVLNKTSSSASPDYHAVGALTVNSGATAQLSGSGGYQIYQGATPTVNSGGVLDMNGQNQTFTSAGPTISGTGISGAGALVNNSGNSTLTSALILGAASSAGGSGNLIITGIISGNYVLNKVGAGTLTVNGANTYGGNTIISNGTLKLGAAGVIPDGASKGNVSVVGTLDLNTYSETINGLSGAGIVDTVAGGTPKLTVGANDQSSTFSGIVQNTSGTLALTKVGTGTLVLSNNNTFAGGLWVEKGVVRLQASTNAMGAGLVNVGTNATLDLNYGAVTLRPVALTLYNGNVTKTTANTTTWQDGFTNYNSSTVTVSAGNFYIYGGMDLASGTLVFSNVNQSGMSGGTMTGAGHLTKQGAGIFNLRPGTHSGNITVSAGTIYQYTGAMTASGTLTMENGTTYRTDTTTAREMTKASQINGNVTLGYAAAGSAAITFSGAVDLNAGTRTITMVNTNTISGIISNGGLTKAGVGKLILSGANTYASDTTISAGTLQLGAATAIPDGGGKGDVSVTGILDMGGFSETINGLTGAGTVDNSTGVGTYTLTVGNDNDTTTFSGALQDTSGTLALTKAGSGTLTLSGANTHDGATTISVGSLIISGSANNSAFTVASGATLIGDGSVADLAVTGIVRPGNSSTTIGSLDVANLTMNDGSAYYVQLGDIEDTDDRDYINNAGTATINATVTVYLDDEQVSNWDNATTRSWNIIVGGIDASDLANCTLDTTAWNTTTYPLAGGEWSLGESGGNLVLTFTKAAEPTPDIAVLGTNLAVIADGATEPQLADGTDFGDVAVVGGTSEHTFTVTNAGLGILNLENVAIGGTHAADFSISAQLGINSSLLSNGDMSTGTLGQFPNVPTGWGMYGANDGWYQTDLGQRTVCMWANTCVVYQDWACSPGHEYLLAVGAYNRSATEPITSGEAWLKVEWYDASSTRLGESVLDYITSASAKDTWVPLSGLATAAVGSVTGRVVIGFNTNISASGKVFFDDASVICRSLGAGSTTTFKVTFDPSAVGTRTAAVYITNNVTGKTPYDFVIQGTGTFAEIAVNGNGNDISDGDATPSLTDHTYFGNVGLMGSTLSRT
ncbi:MAG: autotransporter-associated beta strand repeat-containing protein, partial [Verrucomicrobiota bacterium]